MIATAVMPVCWAAVGGGVGAGLGSWTPQLLIAQEHRRVWLTNRGTATMITTVLFGLLAWRLDSGVTLLLDSVVAAIGVPLAVVDVLEQRLPTVAIWPPYLIAAVIITGAAVTQNALAAGLRAAEAAAALIVFYLAIALLSRGGLGSGDIRLAGLLGLILGWNSWSAVVMGTVLTFILGGCAGTATLLAGRPRDSTLPLGPAMIAAALTVAIWSPALHW